MLETKTLKQFYDRNPQMINPSYKRSLIREEFIWKQFGIFNTESKGLFVSCETIDKNLKKYLTNAAIKRVSESICSNSKCEEDTYQHCDFYYTKILLYILVKKTKRTKNRIGIKQINKYLQRTAELMKKYNKFYSKKIRGNNH